MTPIDWAIVVFALLLAVMGVVRGFVVGALTLLGFGLGALLGTRLAPHLLNEGSASPWAPLIGLMTAIVLGTIAAGLAEAIGLRLRGGMRSGLLNALDGLGGAMLATAAALALVWLAGAVALQAPATRQWRGELQRSVILGRLNDLLPPAGPILNALSRVDPFPSVSGPRPQTGAPATGIGADPDVRAASGSIVRITGTACGLGIAGSGWVVGPDLVVTNAHVVAGEDDTVVRVRGTATERPAQVVAFTPDNDIAVLRVPRLGARALPFAPDPQEGDPAAVLGFPENGPYDVHPARLGVTRTVLSQDAYGEGPISRSIAAFRGLVRPGNSGGPLIDKAGRVVATVFARSTDPGPNAGYGVPNAIVRDVVADGRATAAAGQVVATGRCTG